MLPFVTPFEALARSEHLHGNIFNKGRSALTWRNAGAGHKVPRQAAHTSCWLCGCASLSDEARGGRPGAHEEVFIFTSTEEPKVRLVREMGSQRAATASLPPSSASPSRRTPPRTAQDAFCTSRLRARAHACARACCAADARIFVLLILRSSLRTETTSLVTTRLVSRASVFQPKSRV